MFRVKGDVSIFHRNKEKTFRISNLELKRPNKTAHDLRHQAPFTTTPDMEGRREKLNPRNPGRLWE